MQRPAAAVASVRSMTEPLNRRSGAWTAEAVVAGDHLPSAHVQASHAAIRLHDAAIGQRRTMALHRLDSVSERGALLLLQGRAGVTSRVGEHVPLRFTRGCGFANHWIIGEKLASFCAITITGCDNSSIHECVSARLTADISRCVLALTNRAQQQAHASQQIGI